MQANAMSPEVGRAVVEIAKDVPKLDTGGAKSVIHAWLRAKGFTLDSWGNYIVRAGEERWHFQTRVVQHQEKMHGEWRNIRSISYLDLAANLVHNAAEATGRHDEVAHLLAAGKKRRADTVKRASQAVEKGLEEKAKKMAVKRALSLEPQIAWRWAVERAPEAREEMSKIVQPLVERMTAEFLVELQQGHELEDIVSVYDPPVYALMKGVKYRWVERVAPSEQPYSIELEGEGADTISVQIGTPGGFIAVHPVTHHTRMVSASAVGDAYVAGKIWRSDPGRLNAAMFLAIARAKRQGAGSRVLKLWCRLLTGYGIQRFIAEAVGDEGGAWLTGLAARGEISIDRREGPHWVVDCKRFGERPGAPEQVEMFRANPHKRARRRR